MLVVKYEDFRLSMATELKKMLDYLQAPYSTPIVQELALNVNKEELSVVYTDDERDYINSIIRSTIETLANHKVEDKCDLSVYLR